jgi:nicotinate dehydrogenase subunit B
MAFLTVNGERHEIAAAPERLLLHLLREDLGLTGPKLGCAEGSCGVCTVLVDGEPVRACVTALAEVGDRAVTTIEGLAAPDALHPVQRAFVEEAAFQCGYCTGGMVLAAVALLARNPQPSDAEIEEALQGNICRCGTHPRIVRAVRRAAEASPDAEPMAPPPPGTDPTSLLPMPAPWDRSHETDALFDALGDGLLVVPDDDGGAWLHVGGDGRITVASGKVEVGQGSTMELARVAASQLGIAPGSVNVILGDTHLCPYDMGTFGSLTTPTVVPAVRAAAATARAALIELGGADVAPGAWGDIVRGRRRVELVRPVPGAGSAEPDVDLDGPAVERRDVVTGQRRYTSDLVLPGMLNGAVLRPPTFGAQPWSVDTSAAEQLPGVRVLAEDGFVAVAAPGLAGAGAALERVQATWEGGGGIGQAELADHLRSHPVSQPGWGGDFREEHGDVDGALDAGQVRCDATYTTAFLAHEPLETRAALAAWDEAGDRLTVWTGTQRPFGVREQLAAAFDMPEEHVRVIAAPTGAAYGGKHTGEAAIEASRIARAVRRPVHLRWTREEETTWGYVRPAAVIDVRSAAGADGHLRAWEFVNLNSGPHAIRPPYRTATQRLAYQPAASPLRQGSYRALSATANTFARESHVDELAHALGADPVAFRLQNLADERLATVLRAAAERAGWPGPWREPSGPEPSGHGPGDRALGIACSTEKDSRVATCVEVRARVGQPLQLLRIVTAFECGAIVDRENLENQVAGATIMGLGGALFEAVRFEEGRVTNAAQSAYRVPRFRDVPPIEVILLDRPDLPSAGAGETPIIALAPAIANAIFAATGVRLRSMPLVPDGIVPSAG